MGTVLQRARQLNKAVVVCGCVPQGDRHAAELQGLSLLGEALLCVRRSIESRCTKQYRHDDARSALYVQA